MMDNRFGSRRVQAIDCELYTESTRLAGVLRSSHRRFSDMMNSLDQDFVSVWDAEVSRFDNQQHATLAQMLIRKSTVILAASRESRAGRELSPDQRTLLVTKEQLKVAIEAGPYTVVGIAHMGAGVDLLQHVHETHRVFMPITMAEVSHRSGVVQFTSPFVLVNRRAIEVIYAATALGHKSEQMDEEVGTQSTPQLVPAAHAAEVLLGTDVFKRADAALLEQACEPLCVAGAISQIQYGPQSDIFLEGDWGETMYVVEDGIVAVSAREGTSGKERQMGYLKNGAVVGEMAALGNGARTATVRTVTGTTLLALHEDAVKNLLELFPSAATALFQLVVERQEVNRGATPAPSGPLGSRLASPGDGTEGLPAPRTGGLSARLRPPAAT